MSSPTAKSTFESSGIGNWNMIFGLWTLGTFMFLGFVLIYLRDFAPGAEEWAAQYSHGKHFETRLAHVHGALFGFLNVLIGLLLAVIPLRRGVQKWVSGLALAGILMPVGILTEVVFGVPPILVLIGAISMTTAMILHGFALWKCVDRD